MAQKEMGPAPTSGWRRAPIQLVSTPILTENSALGKSSRQENLASEATRPVGIIGPAARRYLLGLSRICAQTANTHDAGMAKIGLAIIRRAPADLARILGNSMGATYCGCNDKLTSLGRDSRA
jgi:hypothetical protein